jgi:hypothetical protein
MRPSGWLGVGKHSGRRRMVMFGGRRQGGHARVVALFFKIFSFKLADMWDPDQVIKLPCFLPPQRWQVGLTVSVRLSITINTLFARIAKNYL